MPPVCWGPTVVPGMAVKLGNSPRAIKTLTTEPFTLMRFTPSANASGRCDSPTIPRKVRVGSAFERTMSAR